METQRQDAIEALAAVERQRKLAAERLVTPWWYHPTLGLLVGGLVAAQAGPGWAKAVVGIAFGLGFAALVTTYRRITGVWVNGYRRGRAGRVTGVLLASYIAMFLGGVLVGGAGLVIAGALIAVLTVILGRRFDEELRAELRA